MTTQTSEQRAWQGADVQRSIPTVLVVDDDEQFRDLARGMLEPAGFQVLDAESLPQCLDRMRTAPVDVVVMDMVMPGSDGIESVREIRSLFPSAKILTVSGAEAAELYLRVSSYLGAEASLSKSKIAALCPLIRVVLGS
jgi:CheY-like chemotaxis protein